MIGYYRDDMFAQRKCYLQVRVYILTDWTNIVPLCVTYNVVATVCNSFSESHNIVLEVLCSELETSSSFLL